MIPCPGCGAENPRASKFCSDCGNSLVVVCEGCGTTNSLARRFCQECGTRLSGETLRLGEPQSPSSPKLQGGAAPQGRDRAADGTDSESSPRSDGERRHLTVMFCDLVDSTALAAGVDPEDWQATLSSYHHACSEGATEFGGHIAQYLGDGVLVYFGYPVAHEDEGRRAIRAALRIVEVVGRLKPVFVDRLRVRIGIHAGSVVVSEVGYRDRHEHLALGQVPNVAARIQAVAEPDTVAISDDVRQLVIGLFDCQDLGARELKGLRRPIHLFRPLKETRVHGRFEVAIGRGLNPLVGREVELGLLKNRWLQARHGSGQVVLVRGEAGIGKSRLLHELKSQVAAEESVRFELLCSPYYTNTALYPVIQSLHRILSEADERNESRVEHLEQLLGRFKLVLTEVVPLFANLMSLPLPERYEAPRLAPQKLREKTREALLTWLFKEAEESSLFPIVEDLHWADPSTLELLDILIQQAPTSRVFLAVTARPEFQPSWMGKTHVTVLSLSRLLPQQREAFVRNQLGESTLPRAVMAQIIEKSDGVPLYIEELTKAVVESSQTEGVHGGSKPPFHAIPTTLHDSLAARLDRLADAKEVAQLGAAIGREFRYDLISDISQLGEEDLTKALGKLVRAEVLQQRGFGTEAAFVFKHALIQEAAYQSLLKKTRQQYHRRIASALRERSLGEAGFPPEILAHHYTEADMIPESIPLWQQAAQSSVERWAIAEAYRHLDRGLELLEFVPNGPERARLELSLQTTQGVLSMFIRVAGRPRPRSVFSRVKDLSPLVADGAERRRADCALSHYLMMSCQYEQALVTLEPILLASEKEEDPDIYPLALGGAGSILFYLGDLLRARDHMVRSINTSERLNKLPTVWSTGVEPALVGRLFAGWNLWLLGQPDQAKRSADEAIALTGRLAASPYALLVHYLAAQVAVASGDYQRACDLGTEIISRSTKEGFEDYVFLGGLILKMAKAWLGEDSARSEFLSLLQGIGARVFNGITSIYASAGELCLGAGMIDEGTSKVEGALAIASSTHEGFYEAELQRLRGELSRRFPSSNQGDDVAEQCFLKAIDIAVRQGAKSLELRVAMSVARLWRAQGRVADAHQVLSQTLGWFTEGFGTRDLVEAQGLLDKLHPDSGTQ